MLMLLTAPVCVCVEFVFSLDATDEFLKERVLNLPESMVQGTSHSFDRFLPRLVAFRKNDSKDEIVLNYFDELEINLEHIGRYHKVSFYCHIY